MLYRITLMSAYGFIVHSLLESLYFRMSDFDNWNYTIFWTGLMVAEGGGE